MTEIEFHFNVPDKLQYACRLVRKVYRGGFKVVVTAEADLLSELDQLLWSFSAKEFVPHCLVNAQVNENTLKATPVLLTERPEDCPPGSILMNMGRTPPLNFERFERFIEVVANQEEDRILGRTRWSHYKDRGYALRRHDLSVNTQAV